MKAAVLVLAALQLQAVLGGFSVRMPFLNPAGVTYVEGPAPVGLAAGPAVAYSAPAAHAVYPAAAHYAAPVAPVAYAAHVKTASVGYAAVPTVQHVPAVQDVPYTRIEATPGVVQKVVDVAKPAVATRRFEIRRPAIQKQFYDIEERVVVRPAGSALVELDQPLSKSQKGATVVTAAAPVVAAAPVAYAAAAPVAYAAHAKVLAAPVAYATHAKVLAAPVAAYPSYPAYPALSAAPIVAAPVQQAVYPQEGQQQQFEQQQADQAQQQADQQQQFEQQQADQAQQQFDQQQQQFNQQQQQFDQAQQQQQLENREDDSVEVSNPDLTRSAPQQPAAPAPQGPPAPEARAIPTPEDLLRQFGASPALRQLQAEGQALDAQRQQLQARMAQLVQQQRQQQQDAEALAARERHLAQAHASQPSPQGFTEARFAPRAPAPRTPAVESRSLGAAPAPVVESRSLGAPAPLEGLIPAPRSGNDVVPSVRNLSPEQSQENQQRLIQLLTAQVRHEFLNLLQGGVTEVGSARSGPAAGPVGEAGQVRARVISATPAPDRAEPTGERVQTRRVVVSRPIETVQEIDVVEPFTKIHRLNVQQPALFKTAVHDVARVHTSVPVYGKALAPYTVYH